MKTSSVNEARFYRKIFECSDPPPNRGAELPGPKARESRRRKRRVGLGMGTGCLLPSRLEGSGERHELPQRALGRRTGRERIFSERELTFTFAICCRQSVSRLSSVCLSSVTFVRRTQAVQIFGDISMALGTLALR